MATFSGVLWLEQLHKDKWNAYGWIAIGADALLTVGVVILAATSIAFSPSAQETAKPPDCSRLHGEGGPSPVAEPLE